MRTLTRLDTEWDNFPRKKSKLKRVKLKLKEAKDSILSLVILLYLIKNNP